MAKTSAQTKKRTSPEIAASPSFDLSSSNYFLPFFAYLTIPKNTTRTNYMSQTLALPKGQVHKLWVEFPKGCSGLAGVQVWRNTRQIFPLPADVWLKSDNSVLNFSFTEIIQTDPYSVEIRAYNLDDTYQHVIWLGFEMRGLYSDIPPQLQGLIDFIAQG